MIEKVAVIGAGTMGRGIAFATALKGLSVNLQDINQTSLDQSKAYIKEQFETAIKLGKITEEEAADNFEKATILRILKKLQKTSISSLKQYWN